jgi:hypothetical protein
LFRSAHFKRQYNDELIRIPVPFPPGSQAFTLSESLRFTIEQSFAHTLLNYDSLAGYSGKALTGD